MKASVFVSMSDRKMASLIEAAKCRVAVATPAVRAETAKALQNASTRLGCDRVAVVMDCDENVFRLGYGDIQAVKSLRDGGCVVRQSSGLRVGVLVCDELAWVFSPTALYVQAEVQGDDTPNAVCLRASDVDRVFCSVFPGKTANGAAKVGKADPPAEPEIGHEELNQQRLEQTEEALEQAPPVQFDIARQVHVFEPYLQYVELSLTGAAIQRNRVHIPKPVQSLGATKDLHGRLKTTLALFEKGGQLSSKGLESELNEIRKHFTRSLGKNHGRVMLKSKKGALIKRLAEFREKLLKHQEKLEDDLQEVLNRSSEEVLEYYLPLASANPPDDLVGGLIHEKPTDQDIRNWLKGELEKVFPQATDLIKKMTLEERYKDVTFETLNRADFLKSVKKAFPHVNWEKAHEEFRAAGEKAAGKKN